MKGKNARMQLEHKTSGKITQSYVIVTSRNGSVATPNSDVSIDNGRIPTGPV